EVPGDHELVEEREEPPGEERLFPAHRLLHQSAFDEFAPRVLGPEQVGDCRRPGHRVEPHPVGRDVAEPAEEVGDGLHGWLEAGAHTGTLTPGGCENKNARRGGHPAARRRSPAWARIWWATWFGWYPAGSLTNGLPYSSQYCRTFW